MDLYRTINFDPKIRVPSMDSDGDVIMKTPQPLYGYIQAPRIVHWNQRELINWKRQRLQYEQRITECCAATGGKANTIMISIRSNIEPRLLDHLAKYTFHKSVKGISDEELLQEVEKRCGELKNSHVPNINELFTNNLKMDMQEDDIEARIVKYFILFEKILRIMDYNVCLE